MGVRRVEVDAQRGEAHALSLSASLSGLANVAVHERPAARRYSPTVVFGAPAALVSTTPLPLLCAVSSLVLLLLLSIRTGTATADSRNRSTRSTAQKVVMGIASSLCPFPGACGGI